MSEKIQKRLELFFERNKSIIPEQVLLGLRREIHHEDCRMWRMDQYCTCDIIEIHEIDKLRSDLSAALERERVLREALVQIADGTHGSFDTDYKDIAKAMMRIAQEALKTSDGKL